MGKKGFVNLQNGVESKIKKGVSVGRNKRG